jgi:hypothetical protein
MYVCAENEDKGVAERIHPPDIPNLLSRSTTAHFHPLYETRDLRAFPPKYLGLGKNWRGGREGSKQQAVSSRTRPNLYHRARC